MKTTVLIIIMLIGHLSLFAQEAETYKFYIGLSYGTSFSLGDFKDDDPSNPDAGFAENGQKIDLYGGYFLNDKVALTATFRYQNFETDISRITEEFQELNPGTDFTVSKDNWRTYALLVGPAYLIPLSKKFSIIPRFGIGPLFAENPGFDVQTNDGTIENNFIRSTNTGIGFGYEIGIGFKSDIGKHFALMPAFTYGGGIVQFDDIITEVNNVTIVSDYDVIIQAFNIGIALSYKFGAR